MNPPRVVFVTAHEEHAVERHRLPCIHCEALNFQRIAGTHPVLFASGF